MPGDLLFISAVCGLVYVLKRRRAELAPLKPPPSLMKDFLEKTSYVPQREEPSYRRLAKPVQTRHEAPKFRSKGRKRDTIKVKGEKFEHFVVKMFPLKNICTFKDWRSDKIIDGVFAENNRAPDLEIEIRNQIFLIECKFRGNWQEDDNGYFVKWSYNLEHSVASFRSLLDSGSRHPRDHTAVWYFSPGPLQEGGSRQPLQYLRDQ